MTMTDTDDALAGLHAERADFLERRPDGAEVWDALERPLLTACHGHPTEAQVEAFCDLIDPILRSTPEAFPRLVEASARMAATVEGPPARVLTAGRGARDERLFAIAAALPASLDTLDVELTTTPAEGESQRERLDRRARALAAGLNVPYVMAAQLLAADDEFLAAENDQAAAPLGGARHGEDELQRDRRRATALGLDFTGRPRGGR
jgi:hypothetical protein